MIRADNRYADYIKSGCEYSKYICLITSRRISQIEDGPSTKIISAALSGVTDVSTSSLKTVLVEK